MTKEEFEEGYARWSKLSVARLHELGLRSAPCDCGEDGCHGWQMTSRDIKLK